MKTQSFGEMLKTYRNRHRLTQEQLSDKLRVKIASIHNWEQDRTQPRGHEAIRIYQFMKGRK